MKFASGQTFYEISTQIGDHSVAAVCQLVFVRQFVNVVLFLFLPQRGNLEFTCIYELTTRARRTYASIWSSILIHSFLLSGQKCGPRDFVPELMHVSLPLILRSTPSGHQVAYIMSFLLILIENDELNSEFLLYNNLLKKIRRRMIHCKWDLIINSWID